VEGAPDCLLALSGAGVPAVPAAGVIAFATPVRTPLTLPLTIANPTGVPWRLQPAAQPAGGPWSAPDLVLVPAGGSAACAVTFSPAATTPPSGAGYEGSVFLALPGGGALLHALRGVAGPPLAAGALSCQAYPGRCARARAARGCKLPDCLVQGICSLTCRHERLMPRGACLHTMVGCPPGGGGRWVLHKCAASTNACHKGIALPILGPQAASFLELLVSCAGLHA
jgi:hypothetical protein